MQLLSTAVLSAALLLTGCDGTTAAGAAAEAQQGVPLRQGMALSQDIPLSQCITNGGDIVLSIRQGLHDHAHAVSVSFRYDRDILGELAGVTEDWVEAALAETEDPEEGDYIRAQYGGYEYACSYELRDGEYFYTVRIVPEYYTYRTQEETVRERAAEILRELGIPETAGEADTPDRVDKVTTFPASGVSAAEPGQPPEPHAVFAAGESAGNAEIVRDGDSGHLEDIPTDEAVRRTAAIYDYLCRNVSYDKVHRKNPYVHTKSTAYSALALGTATCQGYCAAGYRLLKAAGVDCRIITGSATGEAVHAWLIAKVGGAYYCLDPTWDAGHEEYRYFLKGTADFADHIPAEKFRTEAFRTAYPLSEESYLVE